MAESDKVSVRFSSNGLRNEGIVTAVRDLSRPPIAEAVIDVQFVPNTDIGIDAFEEAVKRLFVTPEATAQRRYMLEAVLKGSELNAALDLSSSQKLQSLVISNAASNRIVSVAPDRLSVAHRAPYGGWDSIVTFAEESFHKFVGALAPPRIKRIAARFTNVISAEGPEIDLDEYVTWSLGKPANIESPIIEFSHRTVLYNEEENLFGIVIFKDQKSPDKTKASFVVDIDAFCHIDIETSFDVVAEKLAAIRKYKNYIFFGMMTEKTLEKYV